MMSSSQSSSTPSAAPDTGSVPDAARLPHEAPPRDGAERELAAPARGASGTPASRPGQGYTRRALLRLRLQLTAWYVGTFALILFVLGSVLFAIIAGQIRAELNASLRAATRAIAQAAAIREVEAVSAKGAAVDAVKELTIPGRSLYLLDSVGTPLIPSVADGPIVTTAREAADAGTADRHFAHHAPRVGHRDYQVHAERFALPSGRRYVAAAVADRIELEHRYASLIAALAGSAAAALLLVAAGGWFLSGKATAPVERSMGYMRQFMADAAHELRTPVAVLRSRAEVALQRTRDPDAYVAALSAVGREAERIGGIVDDLLTLARAEAGERPLVSERVYLDDVAMDAVDGVRVLAERGSVELTVSEFEEAAVDADPALLRQLIVIVLHNAIKFTRPGGRVSLRVRSDGGKPTLLVDDTGVGIPAVELPHIFDRFYRGSGARAHGDGAGLGLSIARWITDAHGAAIDVASAPGVGTRVTIRFRR